MRCAVAPLLVLPQRPHGLWISGCGHVGHRPRREQRSRRVDRGHRECRERDAPAGSREPHADRGPVAAARPDPVPLGHGRPDRGGRRTQADTDTHTTATPDTGRPPSVLDVLAANGAHATFFMIGQSAAAHPDLVARVRAEGHAVGNHTWSHPSLTAMSVDSGRDQVSRTSNTLGGTSCARPPYGSTNAAVTSMFASLGQRMVMWDIDTRDWSRPGTQAIVNAVNSGAKEGAIILMHDGGNDRSQTLEAVRQLVPALQAAGWRLEALPGC